MPTKTLRAGMTRWTVIRCECDEVFQFDSPCSDFELLAHLEEMGGAASLRLLTAACGTKRRIEPVLLGSAYGVKRTAMLRRGNACN
jgi:hypothetical protein